MTEDLPEAHNRVTLTDELADDGLPSVKLSYQVSENTQRMLTFGMDRAQELLVEFQKDKRREEQEQASKQSESPKDSKE